MVEEINFFHGAQDWDLNAFLNLLVTVSGALAELLGFGNSLANASNCCIKQR